MNNNRFISGNSITNNTGVGYSGSRNFFPGCFVNGANDINPEGILSDGTLCLYPQSDYKAIYAKQWTRDGLMSVKYVPEIVAKNEKNKQEELLNAIFDRLNAIERKMNQRYSKNKKYNPESKQQNG